MSLKIQLILIVIFLNLLAISSNAQIGGQRSFEFLNLPSNALPAAVGGVNVSTLSTGPEMSFANPALLNSSMTEKISFTHLNYFADINFNGISYAHKFNKPGLVSFNVQLWNYGELQGYDLTGQPTGEFKAQDIIISVGHSQQLSNFTLGANLKFASSGISSYNSNALLLDIGGTFNHPKKDMVVGVVLKNIGFVINQFNATQSKLPFDLQIGASLKPEHMPVRFSVTAYNLYKGNIAFFDRIGQADTKKPGLGENIFRHFNFGTEFILSKNFNLRAGYNPLIRKELRLNEVSGGAGFSFGFMLRIKSFELAYSNSRYHAAGGANYISILIDFNKILKKNTSNT